MKYIFVYITVSSKREAEKIARHLLKKRLIACANIFPVESFYWWKEKIEKSGECVMIGKTRDKFYKKIIVEVEKIHSYSMPCVAKLPIEFNGVYEKWLRNELERQIR